MKCRVVGDRPLHDLERPADSGTRCTTCLHALGGHPPTARSTSNSAFLASNVSPDRAAVRIVNSRVAAAVAWRFWRSTVNRHLILSEISIALVDATEPAPGPNSKSRNLTATALDALVTSGMSPNQLQLEITETVPMHNTFNTLITLVRYLMISSASTPARCRREAAARRGRK